MGPKAVNDLKVIITGGASGIGAETARLLAKNGASIIITDVQDEKGEALAAELGPKVLYHHLDVARPDDWSEFASKAEHSFGPINGFLNNAGILKLGSVIETSPDDFKQIIDVNLVGIFLGIHFIAPLMIDSGGGVIVNTSSTAGLQGYSGLSGYVASKWGVRGLTKSAALDLAKYGVRVVSIHPGPIRTPMTEGMGDEVASAQPIPRFGEPQEVACMVRFLMTEATFSTGSEFIVDGGAVTGQVLNLSL